MSKRTISPNEESPIDFKAIPSFSDNELIVALDLNHKVVVFTFTRLRLEVVCGGEEYVGEWIETVRNGDDGRKIYTFAHRCLLASLAKPGSLKILLDHVFAQGEIAGRNGFRREFTKIMQFEIEY